MSENITNKIWEESAWTAQTRWIIEGLSKFPADSKITIVMRHSQRNEPEMVNETDLKKANMELTPLGKDMAKLFGEKLPLKEPVRLFHSPRNRCKETAEKIYQGFSEINGKGFIIGECEALLGIGINMQSFLDEYNKYGAQQVILRYLAGIYPPDQWSPALPFYQKGGQQIWSQIENIPEGGINIFISHDFHISIFRFGWFGLPPDERWIDYLGGFAFSIIEDHILLLDYGKLIKLGIPYWWEHKED
jgi:hypothetical protein